MEMVKEEKIQLELDELQKAYDKAEQEGNETEAMKIAHQMMELSLSFFVTK